MLSSTLRSLVVALGLAASGFAQAQSINVPAGGTINQGSGSVNVACGEVNVSGTYLAGTAALNQILDVRINPGGSISGQDAQFFVSGNWNNTGSFTPGNSNVTFNDGCPAAPTVISGNTTFSNLTFQSSTGKVFEVAAGAVITVTGHLDIVSSGTPLQIVTTGAGPQAVIDARNATIDPADLALFGNQVQLLLKAAPIPVPVDNPAALALLALAMASTPWFARRRRFRAR